MGEYPELGIMDVMPFGKWQGELVGTIIEEDPSYMRWVINNTSARLNEEALAYLEDQ